MNISDYWTEVEAVPLTAKMYHVFDILSRHPDWPFLPVLNESGCPVGVVRERNLKQFAYSRFGRELIKRHKLVTFLQPSLTIPAAVSREELVRAAAGNPNPDGIILTEQGRYRAVLLNRAVLAIFEEQRREMEARLIQSQKMETVGKLAAGVAHDLNNILTGLISYPELLLLDLPENNPLRKPILAIQQSGIKAAAVVRDLLSMSRQGVTEKEVFNLNKVIEDYLGSLECKQLQSDHPNVQVEVDLQEDLLNAKGSPLHISQVLMNLLTNAMEANLTNGAVRISTKNCYNDKPLHAYERISEGEYAILSVSDTGIGIGADDLKNIFEPFFTKKKLGRSGTGLGMTLIWSTVKDHDGFIDIQSIEGRGANFDIYFPATRQHVLDKAYSLIVEDCLGKESVLVVDDIPEQREIASMMLRKLGYTVHAVPGGEEAVEFLKDEKVDILVLDMIMEPGIDGCETYRRIIKHHPNQKAIIASGFSESERVKEARELGVGAYIQKPYSLQKIARALRTELDR